MRGGGLAFVEVAVGSVVLEQVRVQARLDDPAVLEHEDAVGVADGGEAMGDDEDGSIGGFGKAM